MTKFIAKKKYNIPIIKISIIILSYIVLKYIYTNIKLTNNEKEFIDLISKDSTYANLYKINETNILNKIFKNFLKIDINNPINMLKERFIYTSSKKENITKSIVKAVVSGISDETYSGAKIKPNIVVKLNGTTLEADTDYTVSFANNKNVGKAKVTIEGMGDYTGTITRYFYIKPKAANIISVKSSKKACIKVTWKKDLQVSGYRIVYATNSKFSKGKTFLTVKASKRSRTITKLSKGKKYYVKVQGYKTIDGKKIYGEYSKVRTVTVKRR